jgi:DNA-binding IclR family transcriptional regulator
MPERVARNGHATSDASGALQGVGRALDILECVAEGGMTATELVEELGIKWATAHRALTYLWERGYLERDDATGVYSIGPRVYAIGSSYVAQLPLVQVARAHLPSAVEQSGATAQLVTRGGNRSVVLSVFEPRNDPVAQTSIGFNWPLNCSSKGHVLLAYEDAAFVEEFLSAPLPALTPHSITDPNELRKVLDCVRERGYAVTARDTRMFSGSVSAPVRGARGNVVACVCLIVPAAELKKRMSGLVETATRTADSISLMIGWRPTITRGARPH